MLKNVYEGLNARPKVYLSKEYFCEMYPTCVSSKLCEFILNWTKPQIFRVTYHTSAVERDDLRVIYLNENRRTLLSANP